MTKPPTGTVTFLFTDIEGSTKLFGELGEGYRDIQQDHQRLMREAIAVGAGHEMRTEGDSFFVAFPSATGALEAAVAAQRALATHPWLHGEPLRVRMGMHTGEGRLLGDDYLSIDVNRAARIAAAGHGGQVLLSDATRALVEDALPRGVSLADLGRHGLKDFDEPQRLHQLVIDGLPSEFPPLKTLETPTNLPVQMTSFVGRDRELATVADLVTNNRIVTLTGPGGTGKTRLAVEAARRLDEDFLGGTFFVDLSPIRDPTIVADTIASALRLRTQSGLPVLEVITDYFRDRSALLVMDNFEQVLEGASTVAAILRTATQVHVLATSRTPLGLSGEREYPVPPLEVPGAGEDPGALADSEAVRLFAERATAVDPSFSLTEETAQLVTKICTRLDGLPLAIELASSRVRVLPLRRMLEQLDKRLPVLVGGPRDAPERQRTLRSAIAWSHDLLDSGPRRLFERLSVFAGGWELDAVGEVANPTDELGDELGLLEFLVQHSLVRRAATNGDVRFGMLETIREFGLERLQDSGEEEAIRDRHAHHFLRLADKAEPYLTGPDQRHWLDLLDREHDNLRAALRWAIDGDWGDLALRLSAPLWRFWYARGHLDEGRGWLDAALGLPSAKDGNRSRARALTALGGIAYWQSDFEMSDRSYREALEIYRGLGDRGATVEALFNLAETTAVRGDPETGQSLLEESLKLARELGDRRGEAWALWGLGGTSYFSGDLATSRRQLEESRRIFEEVKTDTWGLGNAEMMLSDLAVQQGDPLQAREHILRALDTWQDQSNALVLASQLMYLAVAANDAGHPERAVPLAVVGDALRKKVSGQVPDAFFPFRDPLERAAELLDEDAMNRALEKGKAMTLADALAYAREEWGPSPQ